MEELREELKNLEQDTERKRSGYKNLRRDIQEYRAKLNHLQVIDIDTRTLDRIYRSKELN